MTQLEELSEASPARRDRRARHRAKVRAIVAGVPARGTVPERERLHALLDALLDLKDEAAADPIGALGIEYRLEEGRAWDARTEAVVLARMLVREATAWTMESLSKITAAEAPNFADGAGVRAWRAMMAGFLRQGVHGFPASEAHALSRALLALNDATGTVPRLLAPAAKHSRQGPNPLEARRCELLLLAYIAHRHGAGAKKGDVEAEVAKAVGNVTVDALRKWKGAAIKAFGKEYVETVLTEAARCGAAGEPFCDAPDALATLAAERNKAAKGSE
jgi:hypothetical protein